MLGARMVKSLIDELVIDVDVDFATATELDLSPKSRSFPNIQKMTVISREFNAKH